MLGCGKECYDADRNLSIGQYSNRVNNIRIHPMIYPRILRHNKDYWHTFQQYFCIVAYFRIQLRTLGHSQERYDKSIILGRSQELSDAPKNIRMKSDTLGQSPQH
jgi:hypothetical protein